SNVATVTLQWRTYIWNGRGGENLWSQAENWSSKQVPNANDDVYFDSTNSENCITDGSITVRTLTITSGYTGTIVLSYNDLTAQQDALWKGGTISGVGSLIVNHLTWQGGVLADGAIAKVNGGNASAVIAGSITIRSGAHLSNDGGTVQW